MEPGIKKIFKELIETGCVLCHSVEGKLFWIPARIELTDNWIVWVGTFSFEMNNLHSKRVHSISTNHNRHLQIQTFSCPPDKPFDMYLAPAEAFPEINNSDYDDEVARWNAYLDAGNRQEWTEWTDNYFDGVLGR